MLFMREYIDKISNREQHIKYIKTNLDGQLLFYTKRQDYIDTESLKIVYQSLI